MFPVWWFIIPVGIVLIAVSGTWYRRRIQDLRSQYEVPSAVPTASLLIAKIGWFVYVFLGATLCLVGVMDLVRLLF
jgi:hypothetical protein